ncbi:glycosyltransferase [Fructobacillus fructosus]|uniref:GT2 family (WcaE) n=1 Tax=Fructobacillus fructosus TaxID=1631 RepID=A0ABN9YSY7_9LACO|nr:glycosyltransferase family 2 protein [Fructobacillus fructosus]KRN52520.1 glycosyltransferase [Fructobacillus fructosus KCTC 3544]GAP01273.1 glycosyltransferase [Fructobacillus fructosus]CAK1242651.1 GT2 family (WcaE) [Fructobacillus fructosus]
MTEQKKVSAIVVTYNRLDLLKQSIEALLNQEYKLSHIIVVDNNSENDTKEYLESLGDKIDYLRLPENIGGAGGFNKGIRYFMEETEDDYMWIMDDDTMAHPDSLKALMDYASTNDDFSFLSSKVLWKDGGLAKMNVMGYMNGRRIPDSETNVVQTRNATFVSLLVARDCVAKVGLPIVDFFIWGDDIEYTERLARIRPGYFVPASKVTHATKANVGSSLKSDSADRTPRYFYHYRNKMYYARQRGLYRKLRAEARPWLDYIDIFFSNTDNKKEKLAIIRKGVKAGFKFNPSVEFAQDKKNK